MPERTHYSRAPITEAIIDLRIMSAEGVSVENLAALREAVADRYPIQEEEHVQYQQMSFVGTDLLQTGGGHQLNGFRFISEDKREVFYARLDGFAFSIKAPYDRWESFRDEARSLWNLYSSVAMPEGVTRAAMRYINRIDIPNATTGIRLEDYLRTYPEFSVDFPEDSFMNSFFMQLQLWQQDLGCWLIINEAPEVSPEEGTLSVRLDLDLFREQYEEPWPIDGDTMVWEFLERLHDRKNEIFEASITNRTRRLIR
jgi:uncharacterized protein (TIGR04255 family)